MTRHNCEHCVHWEPLQLEAQEHLGACRRYPPSAVPEYMAGQFNEAARAWRHPIVRAVDGCGEWKARD